MSKISLKPNNDYCPQTLFLYGTYDEKGKNNENKNSIYTINSGKEY